MNLQIKIIRIIINIVIIIVIIIIIATTIIALFGNQERINFAFETLFETGVDEMSWDDVVSKDLKYN